MRFLLIAVFLTATALADSDCPKAVECDVVIYGSSPAALTAAIQAQRMGRSAVIVSPETRIGGLTTGGLGDGWQRQLYVREARRLVGETVMTEHHCRGTRAVARPVALGAYGMDSHNVRRQVTKEGFVRNEGNVEDYKMTDGKTRFPPFGIDYGALVPKRGECGNLFVPVCLSASHMAFGSIRMEPVFFALGQVAGTAAAQAIANGVAVQDLPYEPLRKRLVADGQILDFSSRLERP